MGMTEREEQNPLLASPSHDEDERQEEKEDDSVQEGLISRTLSESKQLWRVAGPSIFSRVALYSITVVTQAFAGHLGDIDLAAISIATTVIISISFGFLLGMASALETLCGQSYGAKQYQMLGIYLQRSWIVLFTCSILLLPLFVFATPILKLIGQSSAVAEQTGLVAIWSIPFHLCFPFQFTLQRFLQSQLKTAVIVWVSGGSLALHTLVSWLFVYKLRVGLAGTALTIGFSWWVTVLGMFGYTVCGGCPLTWTGFSTQAIIGLGEFFKLSIASGVMLFITMFGWESMIALGFLAATGVRVANELGAGNAKGAKFALLVSLFSSLVVGMLFCTIVIVFNKKLAMIFSSSVPIIKMVNELAVLLAFTILFNSIQPVLSGAAVGSGWQALAAGVNIGSYYVIGVPLGVLFGWVLSFGITGTWAGMISGTVVQTLILALITVKCEWEEEARKAKIRVRNEAGLIGGP
ncbi:protein DETOXIFICATION 27-like isoform X3 [Rhodamnia argentea]|uniref:Protein DETOXIFICATION n=1 Tax=Rhodamnia argentea TaxID=178133 RepID=A0A8B8P0X2_9MYRT|nr:protein DETOXIFICATION 27-like isoform X3 [Rhodamnia argentea]